MITPTVGRIVWFYPEPRTSVWLLQEGDAAYAGSCRCEWMPYQKGQAAKAEALEAAKK